MFIRRLSCIPRQLYSSTAARSLSSRKRMSKHPPFPEVEASRPDFDTGSEPKFTKVPDPGFKPGQGLNQLPCAKDFQPDGKFSKVDPSTMDAASTYKFMISAITPRPIAFISTIGPDGEKNLAPMSYFNMVSHNPPAIMVSIQCAKKNPDGMKDTNSNIKNTKQFCVSIISEPFLEASNYTSIDAPYDVDEWKLSGLTQRSSQIVKPPHVAESAFSMECEVMHWYDIKTDNGDPANTVIIGRVKLMHVKDSVLQDPNAEQLMIDPEKLRPISRLGGITYGRTNQFMEVPRPVWDKVKDDPEVKEALAKDAKTVQ